ncbi:MAG: SMP-30/gluconolactonase/LRE family protein [Gammaproteobacteria bacterium]
MTKKTEILIEGMTFTEGPRWREDKLIFSDFFTHRVLSVDLSANVETIVETTYQPSGLGWRPDGTLLIVSMNDRKLLSFSEGELKEEADLSNLAPFHCNDMVVDNKGNAYVGNFGFDLHAGEKIKPTNLILVRPGQDPLEVAQDLYFPNGAVITPDSKTLIVGETFGSKLTAFDINEDATLSNRRVWADLSSLKEGYSPVPDGICLDEEGAIWVASPTTSDVVRVGEGGILLDQIEVETNAYACMLGGKDKRTLFISTAKDSGEEACLAHQSARIEVVEVDVPGAGLP